MPDASNGSQRRRWYRNALALSNVHAPGRMGIFRPRRVRNVSVETSSARSIPCVSSTWGSCREPRRFSDRGIFGTIGPRPVLFFPVTCAVAQAVLRLQRQPGGLVDRGGPSDQNGSGCVSIDGKPTSLPMEKSSGPRNSRPLSLTLAVGDHLVDRIEHPAVVLEKREKRKRQTRHRDREER